MSAPLPLRELRASWRAVGITLRYQPFWPSGEPGCTFVHHLEIISDGRVPLPLTSTGYRSHFLLGDEPFAADDAAIIAYVLDALDQAARTSTWKEAEAAAAQLALW